MTLADLLDMVLGCWRTPAPRTLEQPIYITPYGYWPV